MVASLALLMVLKVENGHFVQPRDYSCMTYAHIKGLLTARATQQHNVSQSINSCVHMRSCYILYALGRANPFENAKVHFCRSFAASLNALNGALNGLNVHLCRCSLNDLG